MYVSLRIRIISVVAGVVLITMLSLLWTVQWQARKALLKAQDENALNLLNALVFEVNNEYRSIKFFREQYLARSKTVLKDMVDAAMAVVVTEYQRYQSKTISLQESQKYCIDTLRNMRYDNGVGYFWINEIRPDYPVMIMHAERPGLEGQNLDSPEYNTAMGLNYNLIRAFMEVCKQNGSGYMNYRWDRPGKDRSIKNEKIAYVSFFKPWNWIIGSGFYIEDIERASRVRMDEVIKELRHMSANLRIGGNGYFFIFSGQKKAVVHPTTQGDGAKTFLNPDSGRLLTDEIIEDYKSGKKYSEYRWNKPFAKDHEKTFKRVYCKYFAPLDWYICVSYYMNDVEKPIAALNARLLVLSAVLLLLALAVSVILATSLATPLRRLADAAETIDREGIMAAEIPVIGSTETRELGIVLKRALATIQSKENELKASEENLRITLSSIGDAVIVTDIEGRIIRMNIIAEKLMGWTFAEADGHVLFDGIKLADPYNLTPVENPINRVLLDGNPCRLDGKTVMIAKDGVKRLIDDSCAPIRARDGQMVGVVMAFRDITEQVRGEEVLHQSQKMDSLGQLAGGVAHDFNNMLGGIMACADLIKRKLSAENVKLIEYTELIINTCGRAADLTSKLLSFSRKGKVLSTPINVHEAIGDAAAILERSIDKRIMIVQRLKAEQPIIIGDPGQLQNMVINLGINSAHAMPQGGTIMIGTRDIVIDEELIRQNSFDVAVGNYIEITVEDTGTGIPKEIIDRIFEPFFTTKGVGKGTGLGLSAVYGSVKEHHGAIKVSSEVNVGTVFNIYLPTHEGVMVSNTHAGLDVVPAPGGSGCILLIDDEKIIRTASKNLLEDLGYEVLLAENGVEGVEVYRAHVDKIKVVILDMVMPKMNGANCFYQIRKINPEAKVLMASGFSGNAVIGTLKHDGLAGFINKPYRSFEIARILKEVLSR